MSLSLSFKVEDFATPALEAKLAQCNPARLVSILGPGLTVRVQRHLLSNGINQQGWPSTHFWADAARGTTWGAQGDSVLISINKIGVRQRYYGGTIKPVKAKALAIPISPVSYGHLPSEFPGLFLLKTAKGAYLVQPGRELSDKGNVIGRRRAGGNAGRRQKASLNFLFLLSAGVTQDPDPNVIPSEDELAETSMALLDRAID
jgi:hypothetical protein